MLEAMEPGLGESVQLKAVERGAGMAIGGIDGKCRGIETARVCEGVGELVDERTLLVILRSSIALSMGPEDI